MYPLPAFVIDRAHLQSNLALLQKVQAETSLEILFALKGFALPALMDEIRQALKGVAASSLHEARFGYEYFRQRVHFYAPAIRPEEMPALIPLVKKWVFNSFSEYQRYQPLLPSEIALGLRLNPHYGHASTAIYNPGRPGSRLGLPPTATQEALPPFISGLHVHTLCEANAEAFENLVQSLIQHFAPWLRQVRWLNLGGGHLLTHPEYNLERFSETIWQLRRQFPNLETIYIEPSAAIVWEVGTLAARVLDIHQTEGRTWAMLDVSFTAHMPDTLEMPYKPLIREALPEPNPEYPTYWMGGTTCLAGDEMGPYSFPTPLQPGDVLHFHDMAHYTFVKTTYFNGVGHPALVIAEKDGFRVVKTYAYKDYHQRLSG